MLLSQFPMTFLPTQTGGVVFFIAQFLIFVIISQIFHEMGVFNFGSSAAAAAPAAPFQE